MENKQQVLVLSQLIRLNSLRGFERLDKPFERATRQMQELDNELRSYQIGDSMRSIHWKASAQKRTLLSRKTISIEDKDYEIVLDCSVLEIETDKRIQIEDRMIETMLAVTYFLLVQKEICHVQLDTLLDKRITSHEEIEMLQKISCFIKFEKEGSFSEQLKQMVAEKHSVGRWLMIVYRIDKLLVSVLEQMVRHDDRVMVLIVNDDLSKDDLEELWRVGIMSFQVKTEGALGAYLEREEK